MRSLRTIAALRAALSALRAEGRTVGLVPTMGALHEGHLSLLGAARAECDVVVVSLFVNPTQFGEGEDFERYPRDERRDAEVAAAAGADLLFAPGPDEMYPDGFATSVAVAGLSEALCGAPDRRGASHFDGVATVVTKLFGICTPDVAYFGQKDFQQTLVIKRLVRDLDIRVRIAVCPIVREVDGLALSSRNAYLAPAERQRARALKRALDAAVAAIAADGDRAAAIFAASAELDEARVEADYVEVLSAEDLSAPGWEPGERLVIAVAARIGETRLIDNALVTVPPRPPRLDHEGGGAPGEVFTNRAQPGRDTVAATADGR